MDYNELSLKGISVSCVGIGTWAMGGVLWGGTDVEKAVAAVQRGVDMGITLIDTAAIYGFGLSEEIVGKALSVGGRRDKAVVATKFGVIYENEKVFRDNSSKRVKKEIGNSLRRLKTDHIDIYQVHWPDRKVPFQETAGAMLDLLHSKKIRAIGLSNFSVNEMEEWLRYAPIHTIQPPLNIFERESEREIIPFALKHGISVIAYGSLCRGLLTGKFTLDSSFPSEDMRAGSDPKFQKQNLPRYLAAVEDLRNLAQAYGKTVPQLAVRWVLEKGCAAALWGVRRADQLEPVSGVPGWRLSEQDMHRIDEIVETHIPVAIGNEFMAPPQ
jgi:aryl-alcohol dehydrogenase-like predicted oxidoreductase